MSSSAGSSRVKQAIRIEGLRDALAAFRQLPKGATAELRIASKAIAEDEVARIRAAANDKQSRAVAASVRARSDRVPAIVSGGAKRTSLSKSPKAGRVFFGAEFGGGKRKTARQFRPHAGKRGYWVWPTLRADEERMIKAWLEAMDRIIDEWSYYGGTHSDD